MVQIYDLMVKGFPKELYKLIINDKDSWFKYLCPSCEKQRSGWCFPIDDDNYEDCCYIREYFEKILNVDLDNVRFIQIIDKDITTIQCYGKIGR